MKGTNGLSGPGHAEGVRREQAANKASLIDRHMRKLADNPHSRHHAAILRGLGVPEEQVMAIQHHFVINRNARVGADYLPQTRVPYRR